MDFFKKIKSAVIFIFCLFLSLGSIPASGVYAADPNNVVIASMDSNEKIVYLTFDDGPDPSNTLNAMNILLKYDVDATFFFTGVMMNAYPDPVKEVYDNGFGIGLHGYDHTSLSTLPDAKIRSQMYMTNDVLEKITGDRSGIMRPPYGAVNATVKSALASLNMKAYMWSIDTLDWKHKSNEPIFNSIKQDVRPGSIILMHTGAGQPRAAETLPQIIEYLKAEGYQMKALPDHSMNMLVAKKTKTKFELDGESVALEAYNINDNSYVKLRDLASVVSETLCQFDVGWDNGSQTIALTTDTPYSSADGELGDMKQRRRAVQKDIPVQLNGTQKSYAVYSIDGDTYFKLRDITEAVDIKVDYDSSTDTIKLDTAQSASGVRSF